MARAESYSQLVPGNTGISTRGRAQPTAGALRAASSARYSTGSTASAPSWPGAVWKGSTSSSLSS